MLVLELLHILRPQAVQGVGGGAEGGLAAVDGVHQLHQIGAELLSQSIEGGVGVSQSCARTPQGGVGAGVQVVDPIPGLALHGLSPAVGAELIPVGGGLLDGSLGCGLLCLLQLLPQGSELLGLLIQKLIGGLQLLPEVCQLGIPVGDGLLQFRGAILSGGVLVHLLPQSGQLGEQGVGIGAEVFLREILRRSAASLRRRSVSRS